MQRCFLMEKISKSQTISPGIVSFVKDKLPSGALKPSDKLPTEKELMEQLGVSKTPIREAIKISGTFGVIHIKRGEGTFITKGFSSLTLNPLIFSLIMWSNNLEQLIEFHQHFEVMLMNMIIADKSMEINEVEKVYQSQKERMNPELSHEALTDIDLEFHVYFRRSGSIE